MLLMFPHPLDPCQTDPAVVESQQLAATMTRNFCKRGIDAFEFRNRDGRHYVLSRRLGAVDRLESDQLISFTSSRMVEALGKPWAEAGCA